MADRNVYHDSVTADVTGAQDLAGNAQQDYTPEHEVEVDTLNSAATVEITAIADDTGMLGASPPTQEGVGASQPAPMTREARAQSFR